ncbi:hypothetical protein MJO29_002026, partial [Puccinia striiformis f. sp. tritici]
MNKKEYYNPTNPVHQFKLVVTSAPSFNCCCTDFFADVCYENPEEYNADDGIIVMPVDLSGVDKLENDHYPDAKDLLTCPRWFSDTIFCLKTEMELNWPESHAQNIWGTFSFLEAAIEAYDSAWLEDPTNDLEETIAARA